MMSEQVVLSTAAQHIIIKFITKKNMKSAEILMRLRAKFGDEMPSRTQVYDWIKSFKEGWTEVENVICETTENICESRCLIQ
jgi:hypothetical protein